MSAAASSSSSGPSDQQHLLEVAKRSITDLVLSVLPTAFPDVAGAEELRPDLMSKMARTAVKGQGDLSLPCFVFSKKIKGVPMKTAETLAKALAEALAAKPSDTIVEVKAVGPYVNFFLSTRFMATVVERVLNGSYLAPLPQQGKAKVMIEYSQVRRHTHNPAAR